MTKQLLPLVERECDLAKKVCQTIAFTQYGLASRDRLPKDVTPDEIELTNLHFDSRVMQDLKVETALSMAEYCAADSERFIYLLGKLEPLGDESSLILGLLTESSLDFYGKSSRGAIATALVSSRKYVVSERVSPEDLIAIFRAIEESTEYFGPLKGVENTKLFESAYTNPKGAHITFNTRILPDSYSRLGGIRIRAPRPSAKDVLHSIVNLERVPEPLRTLQHENLHAISDPRKATQFAVAKKILVIGTLAASGIGILGLSSSSTVKDFLANLFDHAGLASYATVLLCLWLTRFIANTTEATTRRLTLPGDELLREAFPRAILDLACSETSLVPVTPIAQATEMTKAYSAIPTDPARAIHVYRSIQTLCLLGATPEELYDVCNNAKFNHKTRRYEMLEDALDRHFARWGVTTEEQKEALSTLLKVRNTIRKGEALARASQIAVDELTKRGLLEIKGTSSERLSA